MRISPLRSLTQAGLPPPIGRPRLCPRDLDCSCHSSQSHQKQGGRVSSPASKHVNACHDPNCPEASQTETTKTPFDHFTDYDHYERCCDGHHHGVHPSGTFCPNDKSEQSIPSETCNEYFDGCDECADEHEACYEAVDVYDDDDDCEQCEVECEERGHEPEDCPRDHPTTRDNCTPAREVVPVALPQLGPTDDFDKHAVLNMMQDITPCTSTCSVSMQAPFPTVNDPLAGMVFDSDMDHWQTFVQTHHCAPDPCMVGQSSQSQHPQHTEPSFGFTFGCDPVNPANHYPWQKQVPLCNVPSSNHSNTSKILSAQPQSSTTQRMSKISVSSPSSEASTPTSVSAPPAKTCEWVMPCGSICGASLPRTEDLKKHIKNSHSTRGTTTCRWKSCTASFATEAALTGHISKKHLTVSDEEGPWKCTHPGCTKSFMYKQVRDDHVASHNGGNRMHCPVCHQWLNCEGSNFKRHMASHGPKNEHMRCRYESLGCKKRFPRLDNLRRHEACCKCGKKAAGVHHHHHRVHVGHSS